MPEEKKRQLEIFWTAEATKDLDWWKRTNKPIAKKIDELVADAREHPFTGIGKPERLRWEWKGYWSRRITGEHRLIYRVDANLLLIAQCRFHYSPKNKRQKK